MSELEEVFGDDFASEYESERQERRSKRNKVDQETVKDICYAAIQGSGFKGSEPRFRYEGDAVPHDVLLMQAPETKIEKFKHSFANGGMSLGMFHLEEIISCAFNEEMIEVIDRIEEGKHYIVIGNYEEKAETDGSGETKVYKNINPVRGIVPVSVAKKYAEEHDEDMQGTSVEEQREQQSGSSTESTDTEESTDDDPEEEEESLGEQIVTVLEFVANKKPEVIRAVAEGDQDALTKLVGVVDNNVSGDVSEDHVVQVFESEIQEIEDDEEEEDDGLDMGGLGIDEDDESDETEEEEPTSTPDEAADEADEPEEEESVDDWF